MDTPLEIARDEYYQRHKGDCTTCDYYRCTYELPPPNGSGF